MDIYNSIASWTGWPPLLALLLLIGGIGAFLYQKHIDFLRDEIEALKRKQQDGVNLPPDVEAKKLADKHKVLTDRIENLSRDKAQNKQKISELERELLITRDEANSMRAQLDNVQEILEDMEMPREGRFKLELLEDIFKTVEEKHVIYIPIRLRDNPNEEGAKPIERGPYKIEVDFPGMFKMYLNVYNGANNLIGQVESPYWRIYNKDYYVTLLEALKAVPSEHVPEGMDVTIYKTSQFHAISPIDPLLIYIKVPCEVKYGRG